MNCFEGRSGNIRGQKRSFDEMSDGEYKEEGNRYFCAKNYERALDCYSRAISKNPKNPVYFTNRALTAVKLNRFDEAVADCLRALELDPALIKGHFFLGEALCEMKAFDVGLDHIQQAIDLAKRQGVNFGDKMTESQRRWRKKRLEVREEEVVMKEVDLRFYLTRLVREDKDKQMGKLINGNFNFVCKENGETMTRKALQSKVDEQTAKRLSELDDLFTKLEDIRNNKEVPDYLCGKITLDIMKDPVITPSGITYERSAIEGHLDRIGHTDPTTGVPLTKEQLIPNRALKEAVDYFVEKNEWALL